MQVQLSTDNHIQGSEELTGQVEAVVANTLDRFSDWLTRVEVQLSDESSRAKGGADDKRCVMEARPAGLQPLTVSHEAAALDLAISGCAKKLARLLDGTAERLGKPRGRISMSGQ